MSIDIFDLLQLASLIFLSSRKPISCLALAADTTLNGFLSFLSYLPPNPNGDFTFSDMEFSWDSEGNCSLNAGSFLIPLGPCTNGNYPVSSGFLSFKKTNNNTSIKINTYNNNDNNNNNNYHKVIGKSQETPATHHFLDPLD